MLYTLFLLQNTIAMIYKFKQIVELLKTQNPFFKRLLFSKTISSLDPVFYCLEFILFSIHSYLRFAVTSLCWKSFKISRQIDEYLYLLLIAKRFWNRLCCLYLYLNNIISKKYINAKKIHNVWLIFKWKKNNLDLILFLALWYILCRRFHFNFSRQQFWKLFFFLI